MLEVEQFEQILCHFFKVSGYSEASYAAYALIRDPHRRNLILEAKVAALESQLGDK